MVISNIIIYGHFLCNSAADKQGIFGIFDKFKQLILFTKSVMKGGVVGGGSIAVGLSRPLRSFGHIRSLRMTNIGRVN